MPIDVQLRDGCGSDNRVCVDGDGTLNVVTHDHPPRRESRVLIPFRQYLTDDGTSSGDNDMKVNGSVNPVIFSVKAQQDKDIYIRSLSILIADAGATLAQFGNLTALTNGIEFCWETQDLGTLALHEGLKSNFDMVRLADGQPAFGSGNSSFKANNVVSTSEAFLPVVNLSIFGGKWGLRLRKGTTDSLFFKINDNLTGVDQFDAVCKGIKI